MQHKKIIVAWMFIWLLALTACGPKGIDEDDVVSIDYGYAFSDWTIIEQWTKEITMWSAGGIEWMESIIEWAKVDDELTWIINWKEIYKSEYNPNNVQPFAGIILTEVMGVADPKVWTKVETNSMWEWVITSIEKDSEWYDSYVVDFNDPKTYSDLLYYIKITNIEKL